MPEDRVIGIGATVIEKMKQHAREDQPKETCALLLGNDDELDEYYSMRNVNQGIDELEEIEGIDHDTLDNIRSKISLEDDGGKVNINEAGEDELEALEGIDLETARRIIQRRRRVGKYENPEIHFKFDPGDFASAQKYARNNSKDVLGVYHSHPAHDSEAYPSEEDQNVGLPGFIYFILNFQPNETIINAFEFDDGDVVELEFNILDSG